MVAARLATPTADELAKRVGRRGERIAAVHLKRAGYRILGRNLLLTFGEADILALAPDGLTIVLVEVKTRERPVDGPALTMTVSPEAAVTAEKHRKLVAILDCLTRANRWEDRPRRIDVVGVEWSASARSKPTVRHHEGVWKRSAMPAATAGSAGVGLG